MRIAKIILDIATQALDSAYSYSVPDDMEEAQVGCAVLVPFAHRQAVGFIMGIEEHASSDDLDFDPAKLKAIDRVVSHSYFGDDGAALAQFMAEHYLAPLSSCVRLFTPPGGVPRMVHNGRFWQLEQPKVGEIDDRWVVVGPQAADFEPRKGAVKQAAILEALQSGPLRAAELATEYGSVNSALKTLEAKGVIAIEHRRRLRGVPASATAVLADDVAAASQPGSIDYGCMEFEPTRKPVLTEGQSRALAAIERAREHRDGHVVLVDGVTGSGKTEVYLQAIEQVLKAGQTSIVLVPEISLTPQTVARFRGRFGDLVAVMHSRMSDGERYDQWDFIRSGSARVVVGARSALFTPVDNLGLIVIDEEHEGSYKQDSAPRYVSRDVAAWLARRTGATLVLGSATPSIEALYSVAKRDDWTAVVLPERANGKPMPEIRVVDMAHEFGGGSRSMFSKALQEALHAELAAGHKAVLLLNQRGFAKFLLCRECGYVPECPSCSMSLTYHEQGNQLVCHHCGYHVTAPARCPECGSPYLKKFGAGTQRVEAELRSVIGGFSDVEDAQVIRMDADTTKGKGAHQRLLEQFAAADAAVLLGTQMIAKGLDFDDVTLVGVINADTQLRLPDFRSGERTFDLIEQVAGRAGRADLPGRVLVQTYWAACAPIQAAARYDRALFLRDELPKRKLLGYPPYVRLADILVWGKSEPEVRAEAGELSVQLQRLIDDVAGPSWMLLPATPCVLTRLKGSYRYHITVKAPLEDDIAAVLAPVFRSRKASKTVNVAVDIDPVSML